MDSKVSRKWRGIFFRLAFSEWLVVSKTMEILSALRAGLVLYGTKRK
jgi:hypothetical protein